MDAVNQLIEVVSDLFLILVGNILLFSSIGAVLGVILSIVFVKKARKNDWMKRSNKVWSFVAKSSYVLLPIAFVLSGIVHGGLWGVHETADTFIQDATDPIIDYTEVYLPNIQSFLRSTVLPKGSSAREIVDAYNSSGNMNQGYVMSSVNSVILGASMSILPVVSDFQDPIMIIKNIDLLNIKKSDLQVFPSAMKGVVSLKLAPIYFACLTPLLIYLGVILLELSVYRIFK